MSNLHAHIETASRDCDGLYTSDYVMTMNADELTGDFGDIEFHARVAGMIVNSYSLLSEGSLKVNRFEDGSVRMSWSEPTDEGYSSTEATFCTDECDEAERSYRDHTAEAAGY